MTEPLPTAVWPAPAGIVPADRPTIAGYVILAELGRGGMGVVYRAWQVSLERLVALKLIRDSALAGPQQRDRFRIEAAAAARVRHPNVVSIYEVGEDQGRSYFTMELVEGGSLDQHLAGRPQLAPQAAALMRTLALAIQHAHTQQVVHRDLKPANILLAVGSNEEAADSKTREASSPTTGQYQSSAIPKITDFGLAKRLDSESTAWTQEGAVLGTASYMAPEQAAGRVREIGPAVDVYALGAILYELLTGRPPFQADSWNATIEQVIHDEPVPPTRLHPDVPRDLETICLKCLEKEPGRRYASAAELAADLGLFLEGRTVAAVPLGASERLARLAARDGYQLVGEISRGPRSTVYRARYGPLQQPVALKVFPTGLCLREDWEARLRCNADQWAFLSHPQLMPVQRAGWWDDAPYLAVEYVPQGSLVAKVAGRPYPVAQALRLVAQLAEIVSYLHRQGVVHGNLKPSNVLLAADDIPRLTDFRSTGGLFLGSWPTDDSEPAGLGYLTPEQVRDPSAEPRPYTDIYGLGVILYELLTGRPPFGGATAREILEQVRSQDPVPPAQINPEVTPPLEAFCLQCLRKNRWWRYERAYDVHTRARYFHDALGSRVVPNKRWPKRRPLGD
jgi:eukaryotic-like serine/threonine-protein kinase